MAEPAPLLTFSNTVLWLKVMLTAATLVVLYVRYRNGRSPLQTRATVAVVVLFSFAVFQNFGASRDGTFVHYGEMFHYYLGSKYFHELGYYELYDAVIIADAEQDNALARVPFYTDLHSYQNIPRERALERSERVKGLFSAQRWSAFKSDVDYFAKATPDFFFLCMDHGYNASPPSTVILSILTNLVPVTQLQLLSVIDVFLMGAMIALVFTTFGLEMGALFAVYFCVNILNDHKYISGSLLRYDWLLYIVAAVCLMERRRYASSSVFLTLAAAMRIFPAALFYGIAVVICQNVKATGTIDKKYVRFIVAAAVTGALLFLLPVVYFGSALQPWQEFSSKTELHNNGVYVNHLGLRGIVLFEPSHLSFERFVQAYKGSNPDIVRHWQDVKEAEFQRNKPVIVVATLFVLVCVTVIIWRRRASESEAMLWPLLLVYTASYASHYYYAFLCLFVLLFFRRPSSLRAVVPLSMLLVFNIAALITDYCGPSPIVFYTLINIYLFLSLSAILAFELFSKDSAESIASSAPLTEPSRGGKKRRRQTRARGNKRSLLGEAFRLTQNAHTPVPE